MSMRSKIALGFIALIQLVLIILKACKVITLNWALVFMPAIMLASLMVMFGFFLAFIIFTSSVDDDFFNSDSADDKKE